MKPVFKVLLMAVAYLAIFILGACSGAERIHLCALPDCRRSGYLIHHRHHRPDGAAVEEMRPGYDQLMIPVINNVPVLIVVIVLAIPVAILAMRLAEKVLAKPAATLK